MRLHIILGITAAAMLAMLVGSDGYGQFKGGPGGGPGGFGGPGGNRKMGFGQMDPNQRFDGMAQGRNFFLVSEMRGQTQSWLREYAQEKKITFANDQVTREQYIAFADYLKTKFQNGGFNRGGPPGGKGAPTPGTQPQGVPTTLDALNQMSDVDFRNRDQNGDGKLNEDEMTGQLRRDLARFDKNKDGQIDALEYRAYFAERMQQRMANAGFGGSPGMQQFLLPSLLEASLDEELDKRPVVLRAGKLPKTGLPAWFVQLDTDADGQVALYEWRAAGRDLDEFPQWDRDNDGFITPEEAIHAYAAIMKTPDPLLASNADAEKASPGVQFNNARGPGGRMGGPGGQFQWGGGFGKKGGGGGQFPWGGFGKKGGPGGFGGNGGFSPADQRFQWGGRKKGG